MEMTIEQFIIFWNDQLRLQHLEITFNALVKTASAQAELLFGVGVFKGNIIEDITDKCKFRHEGYQGYW